MYDALPEDRFDRQPLRSAQHLLIADVRLDNRSELVEALGPGATGSRDVADSDLLLAAWHRWGEKCLDRIVGDYAFAVYSAADRRLHLARDPLGERPLFYARDGDHVAFASMPSGVLALPRYRRGLSLPALAVAAADLPSEDDETHFIGIHRVPPGTILALGPGSLKSRFYWQPEIGQLHDETNDRYVELYRATLDAAVRPRLRRLSGPIAAQLSSGFDSSAVVATAARVKQPGDDLLTLTAAPRLGFDGPMPRTWFADESRVAESTASMHDTKHATVRSAPSGFSLMRAAIRANQDPTYNYVNLGWISQLSDQAKRCGANILLTGDYGNLSLNAGGLGILGDMLAGGEYRTWWREARLSALRSEVRWRGIMINSFGRWIPRRPFRFLQRQSFAIPRRVKSVYLREHWIRELGDQLEESWLTVPSGDTYRDRLALLGRLDPGKIRKGSLALHGVDQRAPLGDRRVIELSLQLPRSQLLAGGKSRPLARAALSDRLPSQVLDMAARGVQAADWFEQIDVPELLSTLDEIAGNSTARNLLDIARIRSTLRQSRDMSGWSNASYQSLAVDVPLSLATGLFIIEAERWLSSSSR